MVDKITDARLTWSFSQYFRLQLKIFNYCCYVCVNEEKSEKFARLFDTEIVFICRSHFILYYIHCAFYTHDFEFLSAFDYFNQTLFA